MVFSIFSLISEDDVARLVNAAVKAALPPVMERTRDIFREAIKDHEKILKAVTAQHLQVLNAQGENMNKVMTQMNRLIAVGGTTVLLAEYLKHKVSLRMMYHVSKWLGCCCFMMGPQRRAL